MSTSWSVFVTGANRGLGLEMVRQLLAMAQPPTLLFATCRSMSAATELQLLAKNATPSTTVKLLELETANPDQVQKAAEEVNLLCGANGLNLLINNAGVAKRENLENVSETEMLYEYQVNCIAPLSIAKALLPSLKIAAKKNQSSDQGFSIRRAAIVNISTIMASIAENPNMGPAAGGMYSYRASKSALNMVSKSMAVDLKNDHILVIPLHPGWVRTDMGGANGQIDAQESVSGMFCFLNGAGAAEHGRFFDYQGKELPW